MSEIINIDPREVRKAAANLNKASSGLETGLRKFREIEDEIREAWKSRYTSEYIECLEKTEKDLRIIQNSISKTSEKLNKIAESVEQAEEDIQKVIFGSGGIR